MFGNIDSRLFLLSANVSTLNQSWKASCVIFVCKHLVRFFEKHAQNLNTPQNNSASWDVQMGINSAFKGLILNYGATHSGLTQFELVVQTYYPSNVEPSSCEVCSKRRFVPWKENAASWNAIQWLFFMLSEDLLIVFAQGCGLAQLW